LAAKLKALILPSEQRLEDVFTPEAIAEADKHFDAVWNRLGREYTADELAAMIGEADVIITSWGSPSITEEMLAKAPKLKMVGHAAGTMKKLVPKAVFDRGIKLFSANKRIALSVAEYCLGVLLSQLRYLHSYNNSLHAGGWKNNDWYGRELTGSTIGIVSASQTARAFLRLLAPFHVKVKLYDPYLTEEAAAELGVEKATLEQVMQCPIISVHAPNLPATKGIITRELLESIPDGAIFINSSRGDVVDEAALLEQLATGRFQAAFDVYPKEPLKADSPMRSLNHVFLTPHIAGAAIQGHQALGGLIIEDMVRNMNGEPTQHEVKAAQWEITA
jgi:phosphoglycerate dehydrogenase-like enzyme